jgi:hypothetical protein
VIAPASTGKDNNKRIAVINIAQQKRGNLCILIAGDLIFKTVVIKFIAPNIEDAPAICKLNIAKSTAPPECACIPDKGGYTVHPVPAPTSTKDEDSNNRKAGGNSQKLMLFKRGKAMSGAPIIKGTNQLPKPPNKAGITMKKIIIKA